ncbi:hypothetical protein ABPG75_013108 [Micractinium tetrahymenae]
MRRSASRALSLAQAGSSTSSALPIIERLVPAGPLDVERQQQQGPPPPHRSRLFSSKLLASLHLARRGGTADQQQQQREWHHAGEGDRSRSSDRPRHGSFSLQERMEEHPHPHHSHRAPWLRAFVLGANDGLVSTSSLIMGVGAASSDHHTVILSGVAGLVGGALSMAVGEYISVSSQRDSEAADIEQERLEQLKGPEAREAELEELAQIYVERGLPYRLAREVAETLSEKDVVRAHARDELGIDVDNLARPMQAALVSAVTFSMGASIPLLGAAFVTDWKARTAVTIACTTVGLGAFGWIAAWLGGAHKLRAAARVLLGGWLAMGLTYGIGSLFEAAA